MMALHIEIPPVPGRDPTRSHDVARPQQTVPPRLDCSSQDWRQANDYVRTPCLLNPPDPNHHRAPAREPPKDSVHYSAQSNTGQLVFAEVVTSDLKEPDEPRLPSKQKGTGNGASTSASDWCSGTSSICPRCHRCRCEKCRAPRELPRRWCGSWECSADRAVDCVTCMCCVRGTFYHCCSDAEEENDYTDHPCGCCNHPRCLVRWLFIVVVSLFLPCLVLYWPFRGALAIATHCYGSCGSGGCRCDREHPASRPLIEAENASI